MGLFKKLEEKSRGVFSEAPPQEGVAAAPADVVAGRLRAIEVEGAQVATDEEGGVVIAWSALAEFDDENGRRVRGHLYRAIRVALDPEAMTARGRCLKTDSETALGGLSSMTARRVERGAFTGSETMRIISLGEGGGPVEGGFTFRWSDLRDPIIEAVTGAGWIYKPLAM
jgi:hypothetical protein